MTAVTVVLAAVSVSVQAKTLFVGIKGGIGVFTSIAVGDQYTPSSIYFNGRTPEEIANTPDDGHGLDALSVSLERLLAPGYVATMFSDQAKIDKAVEWIRERYKPGDRLVLAGYSAGGGRVLEIVKRINELSVTVDALALIDKYPHYVGVDADNTIYSNVKELYVYYQKIECMGGPRCWNGRSDFTIVDPEKTSVLKFLIDGVDHESIDNDRRVWESLATLLGYTAVDGVTVPKLLRWHIAGWQAGGYKANNQYADYRPIDYVAVVMPGSVRGVFGMKILGYSDKAQVPYKVIDFESIYNVGRSGVPGDFAYCETSLDYTSGQYLLPCQVLQRVRHWQNLGSLDYGSFVGSWTVSTTYMRLDPASPFDDYTCRDSQGRLLLALRVGGSYDTESSCYREVLVVYDGEGSLWQAVSDSGSSDAPETTDGADTPDESTDKRSSGGSSGGGGALSWPILLSFLVFLRKRRS